MNSLLQFEVRQAASLLPYYNAAKTAILGSNGYGIRERTRKPLFMPRAKTKMYKVPPRPQIPLDDTLELRRLWNIYRTQMRTIVKFYARELEQEKQSLTDATSEMSLKEESHEFDRCMKENDIWNGEVAMERDDRLSKKDEEREKQIERIMERLDRQNTQHVQKAEEQIKKWKDLSPTLITRDKLEEAIEKALNSHVDYNYAIDQDGNIYRGREGGPDIEEEVKASSSG